MLLTPPFPYRLRSMQLSDLDAVMLIERDSFASPWLVTGYRYELAKNDRAHYLVVTRQEVEGKEKILGYAGYWLVADEVHISIIAVHPAWRGQGMGALLLLEVLFKGLAANAAMVSLEVRESNVEAQTLYKRYGFVAVGRRKRYYRDENEDAILMDLDLKDKNVRPTLEALRDALWRRLRGENGDRRKKAAR